MVMNNFTCSKLLYDKPTEVLWASLFSDSGDVIVFRSAFSPLREAPLYTGKYVLMSATSVKSIFCANILKT